MSVTSQVVPFRLIQMPCCSHLFCSVNERFPSFCPQCGAHCYPAVRGCVLVHDSRATLKFDDGGQSAS